MIKILEVISWVILPLVLLIIYYQITQNGISLTFNSTSDSSIFISTNLSDGDNSYDGFIQIATFWNTLHPSNIIDPSQIQMVAFEFNPSGNQLSVSNIEQIFGVEIDEIVESGFFILENEYVRSIENFTFYINPIIENGIIIGSDREMEISIASLLVPENTIINFEILQWDGEHDLVIDFSFDNESFGNNAVVIVSGTAFGNQNSSVSLELYSTIRHEYKAEFSYSIINNSTINGSYNLGTQSNIIDENILLGLNFPNFFVHILSTTYTSPSIALSTILLFVLIGFQIHLMVSYNKVQHSKKRTAYITESSTLSYLVYKTIISWFMLTVFAVIFLLILSVSPNIMKFVQNGSDIETHQFIIGVIVVSIMIGELVTMFLVALIYSLLIAGRNKTNRNIIIKNNKAIPKYLEETNDEEINKTIGKYL